MTTAAGGPGCGVCAFVQASTERRVFFLFAEGLAEPEVYLALAGSGGFCPRHARWMLHRSDGYRLADVYRAALRTRAERLGATATATQSSCLLCETEHWAEDHALWAIARGEAAGDPTVPRSADGLCRPHLVALVDRWPWTRLPELRDRLVPLLERAPDGVTSRGTRAPGLDALLGADLDAHVRAGATTEAPGPDALLHPDPGEVPAAQGHPEPAARPPGDQPVARETPWGGGAWTADALVGELEAARCPVCSAVDAAVAHLLRWRAARRAEGQSDADLDLLCEAHVRDAALESPEIATRAVEALVSAWRPYALALPEPHELPAPGAAARLSAALRDWSAWRPNETQHEWRRPSPLTFAASALRPEAALGARRERVRPRGRCPACRAMADARESVLGLLDAMLQTSTGREHYERSDGICLRHLEGARGTWSAGAFALARAVASGRVAMLRWELGEAGRKSSWSVRYEPAGPERSAWSRAMAAAVGTTILQDRWLAPEPG